MTPNNQAVDSFLVELLQTALSMPLVQWSLFFFGIGFAIDRLTKIGILPKRKEDKPELPQIIVLPTQIAQGDNHDELDNKSIQAMREEIAAQRDLLVEYMELRFAKENKPNGGNQS